MLDLDVTPQEGMIFHCTGQASGESRVFEELESEKSRRRDRGGVTPSTDLMPE